MTFSPKTLNFYDFLDALTGLLISAAIIFAPWALGTTQEWSIWTLNILCYAMGALLLGKLLIRWSVSYRFPRWDQYGFDEDGASKGRRCWKNRNLFLFFTLLLVAYCLTSAWNARSIYDTGARSFVQFHFISWLPASYDATQSWDSFAQYLALALAFWALHDWLMGKSPADLKTHSEHPDSTLLPRRLTCLLWVLSVNGALLAIEGIAQRVTLSNKLLFFVDSYTHFTSNSQFGPFNYRSNACQYFNLLWPVVLGFWWTLYRNRRDPNPTLSVRLRHLLPVCVCLMAFCPLISTSRLGAFTAIVAILIAATLVFTGVHSVKSKSVIAMTVLFVLGFGFLIGSESLLARLSNWQIESGFLGRNNLYQIGQKMADSHPVYGTGPGTYGYLSLFYIIDPDEEWMKQLHNDWLETLITFGWVGCALIGAAFLVLLYRWWLPGPIGGGRRLPAFIWLALATCLFQARWDFPFQIYSIFFTFMIVCGILFTLSRRKIH
jgi:O-antigen ligase